MALFKCNNNQTYQKPNIHFKENVIAIYSTVHMCMISDFRNYTNNNKQKLWYIHAIVQCYLNIYYMVFKPTCITTS